MSGQKLLKIISFFDIFLVFSTGMVCLANPKLFKFPVSIEFLLTKVIDDVSNYLPKDENIGLVYTG